MTSRDSACLAQAIASIVPCDARYAAEAQRHLDDLTKPQGSLGRLEAIAAQMFTLCEGKIPLPLRPGAYCFAADHGVCEEGVSAYPREVTAQMVLNCLQGGAAISVLARANGAELTVVDVGVDAEFDDAPGLVRAKVRRGSRNMRREAAMSREELEAALEVGMSQANTARERGQNLVAFGEVGIGNTTAASAIAAALTGEPASAVTGSGTGLDAAGVRRKARIVEESVKFHFGAAKLSPEPLEVLRCVGGLEIAAMTGFILGAAANRTAIVCDGFIATAAAAVACAIAPAVGGYLFAGHCSEEPGHSYLLNHLELTPILRLNLRLGEGTGAVLAMPVIASALHIFAEMATFSSAGVSTKNE
ncbi:MAG: nicotinate-nucleotide--dimethylbenzimidazole phosphoribosyltransferase [Terracidiphilus sp.]